VNRLTGPFVDLFNDYLLRLEEQTRASPENEKLINRNSRLACDLHAHRLICFRNSGSGGDGPMTQSCVTNLVSSFVYLTTRHSWNKNRRELGRLLVPESELYEVLAVQRRRVVQLASELLQEPLDAVMQSVLDTATSLSGAINVSSSEIGNANTWGKLQGGRSRGRFMIVGTGKPAKNEAAEPSGVEDTGLQGVEMDLQLGQMTLRTKHLAALDSETANLEHVRDLFGEHTIQASLLDRSHHRRRMKLIGLRHEIEYWHEGHASCPVLDERWERDYDPADLFESERWIPALFEPIRKAFFDGPSPPAMQFMMLGGPLPESAEVAVLLGVHQHLGGPFKLVYLFRTYRCVHVYECISHARQYWYALHMTSDARYSLRHLQPNLGDRTNPPPPFWKRGAGVPYPKGVSGKLVSNISAQEGTDCYPSVAIIRDAAHDSNLSHGREYYVPECLLYGLFPQALLDTHRFWQDETPSGAIGHKRLRGYPKEKSGDHLLLVDIMQDSAINQVTGRPQRIVRVERRNFTAAEQIFRLLEKVAAKVESLRLVSKPPKPTKAAKITLVKEERRKKFAVDQEVVVRSGDLTQGLDDDAMIPSRVLCDNGDGTYDLEHFGEWAWLSVVKNVPSAHIQVRSKGGKSGEGVWIWQGLSDSEDDAWRSDDSNDDDLDDSPSVAKGESDSPVTLTFSQFWDLEEVLAAANWSLEVCEVALAHVVEKKKGPFHDMKCLAEQVRSHASSCSATEKGQGKPLGQVGRDSENKMLLLDLMYAPRRSRLFSLAKTLSRIENLSHVCVWTRDVSAVKTRTCSIDLVDLPRLKLSFTAKEDHNGTARLFSLDHADLFVSTKYDSFSSKLMASIPFSLLMSNLRGENQLLIPVLPPRRPNVLTEPFSTEIVLDRSNKKWTQSLSQHFYLYPVHVSLAFLMPKGLNSALYLLLLRLLNRDYDSAFRMCDSIATDSKLSPEGLQIFTALGYAAEDLHPDAHAVRLKVTLVTMESGAPFPWDLTNQLASYIAKKDHVSATCLISEQEELQLLSSDLVVSDDQSPKYKAELHHKYSLALVKNRLHQLRSILDGVAEAACFAPPRPPSSAWPWYQDNSVFGEQYNEAVDVKTSEDWSILVLGGGQSALRESLAPSGGWLSVVLVHTLWSSASVKLMSRFSELVPMYPFVSFFTVRGDISGMDKIVKDFGVVEFPSFMVFRGGKLLEGALICGKDRIIERLLLTIGANVTEADRAAYVQYQYRLKEQAGKGVDEDESDEEDSELLWNWDLDNCGSSVLVHDQGLVAELKAEDGVKADPIAWEYTRNNPNDFDWKVVPPDVQQEMERKYVRGHFYQNDRLRLGSQFSRPVNLNWSLDSPNRPLKLENNILEGIVGNWTDTGETSKFRRTGERIHVKGEEKVMTALQEQLDARMKVLNEQREAIARRRRQERRGKNVESIRGSVGFAPSSGVHKWTLRWNHFPQFSGSGDAIGVASSSSEVVGPCAPPLLGSRRDEGASLALYASGQILHAGNIIGVINTSYVLGAEKQRSDSNNKKFSVAENHPESATGVELGDKGHSKVVDDGAISSEITAAMEDKAPEANVLWNKGSLVTCIFDTDKDGGRLSFEIDGVGLDEVLTGVFSMLGGDEVFPCVCMFPVDTDLADADSSKATSTDEGQQEANEDAQRVEGDKKDEEEDEDDAEQTEAQIVGELAKASGIESSVISAMSVMERVDLAAKIKRNLEASKVARVTVVFPIPGTDAVKKKPSASLAPTESSSAEKKDEPAIEQEQDSESDDDEQAPTVKSVAVDEASQPLDRVRWLWETKSGLWESYSPEISQEIETARRLGQTEHTIRVGESTVLCKVKAGTKMTQQNGGASQRLRRHFIKEGLEGQWELMSLVFRPPYSLYGEGALKIMQKVWNSHETMSGKNCALSFLFIYSLFQGQIRCKMLPAGYSDWWKTSGGYDYSTYDSGRTNTMPSSDSHRLGLLLSQLFLDRHTKNVFGSVLNVLGRNKQLCVRMPEFRDNRKSRQSYIFNGWTDESEPKSPLSELFSKLVPLLQGLKKTKQGSLVFPPKPPHPELPAPPTTCRLPPASKQFAPKLSDLDCNARALRPISASEVLALAKGVKHRFGPSCEWGELPMDVEDEMHAEQIVAATPGTLFVVVFHATWCAPCCALAPMIRKLALVTPAAKFLRVDIDQCDALAARLLVRSLPTIKLIRGGLKVGNIVASLVGMSEEFLHQFKMIMKDAFTADETNRMEVFHKAQQNEFGEKEEKSAQDACALLQADEMEIDILTSRPLAVISSFVEKMSRLDRGIAPICSKLSFDVSKHESARTAVAQSMLQRMNEDVQSYARLANDLPTPKLSQFPEQSLRKHFSGEGDAAEDIRNMICRVEDLIVKLQALRASDEAAVNLSISLLCSCANFVDLDGGESSARCERVEFLLRRVAGQAAEAWPEFLFGILISSKGELDVASLNPYIPAGRIDSILQIVLLTMLRANRIGHVSRCAGAAVVLLNRLRRALEPSAKDTVLSMILQAADDLADVIASGRYYSEKSPGGSQRASVTMDPRFLIFEFTWNILLRQKQVEIVNDFISHVRAKSSKVKQMIMGAGKTTVVAPLLALMLADGRSLLLSVVPKALLEMSRTQMRETFANIIPKRVYTFKFERSTEVKAGMRLTLENAARNRGIVVTTPTSLKSVMLVYIETLRNLNEASSGGPGRPSLRENVAAWNRQAKELAGILSLFKEGVMLLDEVDLILHPLKSELNFPLGEKHALDCSDADERWTLPMHMLDAMFYGESKRATVFDARGVALDILRRISGLLTEGYAAKALQRLPHITLLNTEWYHARLKPVMAEWVYLWLQKQHLHGISRSEAITYILEGAVARSEATAKLAYIDAALAKVESELGVRPPLTPTVPTPSHLASLPAAARHFFQEETEHARLEISHSLELHPDRKVELEGQLVELKAAHQAAKDLHDLVHELYVLDEQVEEASQASGRQLAQVQEEILRLQREIQELESPRDDSFDNSIIVWASDIFTKGLSADAPRAGDEALVHLVCGKLEELGFTVRRCGTYEEAVDRAWQLRASGQLRCVIVGGDLAQGCARGCNRSHDKDGKCLVCGGTWAQHSGHSCPRTGAQGSWVVHGQASPSKGIDHPKLLTSLLEDVPQSTPPITPGRMVLFGSGGGRLREDRRLALWRQGVIVTEDKAALLEWAEAHGPWADEDGEEEEEEAPAPLKRESSSGIRTLKALRQRLVEVSLNRNGVWVCPYLTMDV
jgi:thiol-disulfide isomerase/thioredoxin